MDVSSSTGTTSTANTTGTSAPIEALKKSMDVQEQQVLKVLESASEQSKQMTAQKTGMGNSLNLTA